MTRVDSSVPLMHHDPERSWITDVASCVSALIKDDMICWDACLFLLILIGKQDDLNILPKERHVWRNICHSEEWFSVM